MKAEFFPERPRELRRVRYVLLLTPKEMALAQKFARRLHRSVPDFFRLRIYELADQCSEEDYQQPHPSTGIGS
jgi:hypothetical protein